MFALTCIVTAVRQFIWSRGNTTINRGCICGGRSVMACSVFLSGQAGLWGGFQMRAGPGLQAFPAGLAAFHGGMAAFLRGLQAFLGGLSLNIIFCSKDSLLPILRMPPKYET